jgi:hypothetical protein
MSPTAPPAHRLRDAAKAHRGALGALDATKGLRGAIGTLDATKGLRGAIGTLDAARGLRGALDASPELIRTLDTAKGITTSPGITEALRTLDNSKGMISTATEGVVRHPPARISPPGIDTSALEAIASARAAERTADVQRETRMVETLEAVHAELVAAGEREARAEALMRAAEVRQAEALDLARRSHRWAAVAGIAAVVGIPATIIVALLAG